LCPDSCQHRLNLDSCPNYGNSELRSLRHKNFLCTTDRSSRGYLIPMFDQNQPQNQPQITAIYQKMIRGTFLVARYIFSLTGYPKIAHIYRPQFGLKSPKNLADSHFSWEKLQMLFFWRFRGRWIRIWSPFGPNNFGSSYIGFCRLWLSTTVLCISLLVPDSYVRPSESRFFFFGLLDMERRTLSGIYGQFVIITSDRLNYKRWLCRLSAYL